MNAFDASILKFFNQYATAWPSFDMLVNLIAHNNLFKGGVLTVVFWGVWSDRRGEVEIRRRMLLATICGAFVAIAAARLAAKLLPFRVRPLHDAALHLTLPTGSHPMIFDGMSALPSDHAALFFAFAFGIWLVSRPWGSFALAYTTLMIALPRLYLGLHAASDLLAGALVGVAATLLCTQMPALQSLSLKLLGLVERRPAVSYALLFLITYQVADLFLSARGLLPGHLVS